ncbi:hypothetical protein B0H10DRAFT_1942979 [Mycena sp. CBHHK59/15]|nr:hypothetical protein B0H10DRAFT_1942979 [Mycena sp. CBHHK59/15]
MDITDLALSRAQSSPRDLALQHVPLPLTSCIVNLFSTFHTSKVVLEKSQRGSQLEGGSGGKPNVKEAFSTLGPGGWDTLVCKWNMGTLLSVGADTLLCTVHWWQDWVAREEEESVQHVHLVRSVAPCKGAARGCQTAAPVEVVPDVQAMEDAAMNVNGSVGVKQLGRGEERLGKLLVEFHAEKPVYGDFLQPLKVHTGFLVMKSWQYMRVLLILERQMATSIMVKPTLMNTPTFQGCLWGTLPLSKGDLSDLQVHAAYELFLKAIRYLNKHGCPPPGPLYSSDTEIRAALGLENKLPDPCSMGAVLILERLAKWPEHIIDLWDLGSELQSQGCKDKLSSVVPMDGSSASLGPLIKYASLNTYSVNKLHNLHAAALGIVLLLETLSVDAQVKVWSNKYLQRQSPEFIFVLEIHRALGSICGHVLEEAETLVTNIVRSASKGCDMAEAIANNLQAYNSVRELGDIPKADLDIFTDVELTLKFNDPKPPTQVTNPSLPIMLPVAGSHNNYQEVPPSRYWSIPPADVPHMQYKPALPIAEALCDGPVPASTAITTSRTLQPVTSNAIALALNRTPALLPSSRDWPAQKKILDQWGRIPLMLRPLESIISGPVGQDYADA